MKTSALDPPRRQKSSFLSVVPSILICLSLAGCATSTVPVTVALRYESTIQLRATFQGKLTVLSFADLRKTPELGTIVLLDTDVPGLYATKTVSSDQPVGDWVAGALRSELRRAGCTVTQPAANAPDAQGIGAVISGEVLKATGRSLGQGGRADIRIKIFVKKAGTVALSKEYEATGTGGEFAQDGFQRAFMRALQNLLKTAMPEIVHALE